jgi:DNA-binding MarR family transcriptional regulator
LDDEERAAWLGLIAVVELLPGALDSQLRRDAGITHYDYFVLAMPSEASDRTLRMTVLAQMTNATLPRLSHVVSRLEDRGLVERVPRAARRDRGHRTPRAGPRLLELEPKLPRHASWSSVHANCGHQAELDAASGPGRASRREDSRTDYSQDRHHLNSWCGWSHRAGTNRPAPNRPAPIVQQILGTSSIRQASGAIGRQRAPRLR